MFLESEKYSFRQRRFCSSFSCCSKGCASPFKFVSNSLPTQTATWLNLLPLTFAGGTLYTCAGALLLLLSMLIEFLCSLIKRIEFASAVGCYMASWMRTQSLTCTHTCKHTLPHCHARSYPSQLTAC